MGKKGKTYDNYNNFSPTKNTVQQIQYSALRSGTAASPKARTETTDWNAGKLDDGKWCVPFFLRNGRKENKGGNE